MAPSTCMTSRRFMNFALSHSHVFFVTTSVILTITLGTHRARSVDSRLCYFVLQNCTYIFSFWLVVKHWKYIYHNATNWATLHMWTIRIWKPAGFSTYQVPCHSSVSKYLTSCGGLRIYLKPTTFWDDALVTHLLFKLSRPTWCWVHLYTWLDTIKLVSGVLLVVNGIYLPSLVLGVGGTNLVSLLLTWYRVSGTYLVSAVHTWCRRYILGAGGTHSVLAKPT